MTSAERRRLTRSTTDRVIAGVCGGLGEYFGIDPVLVRVAMIVLACFGGGGILIYGLMWLAVPVSDSEALGSPPAHEATPPESPGGASPSSAAERPLHEATSDGSDQAPPSA